MSVKGGERGRRSAVCKRGSYRLQKSECFTEDCHLVMSRCLGRDKVQANMTHSILVTYSVVCLAVPWSSPPGRSSSHGGGGGAGGPSSLDGDVAMSSYEPADLGDRLQVCWCTYVCVCVLMTLCMSMCTIVALTESSNSAAPCSEHSSREGEGVGQG